MRESSISERAVCHSGHMAVPCTYMFVENLNIVFTLHLYLAPHRPGKQEQRGYKVA